MHREDDTESILIEYAFRCTGVFVIESLKEDEWATGKEIYESVIKGASEREGFESHYGTAYDRKGFFDSMNSVVDAIIKKGHSPILHLEIHGSTSGEGFVLASDEMVTWEEFARYTRKINVFLKNKLIICLSTCYGSDLFKSVDFTKPAPFWGFVAPRASMNNDVLLDDYCTFYELFLGFKDLAAAVDSLDFFSDDCPYRFISAELMFDVLWEMAKNDPPKFPAKMTRLERRAAARDINSPLSGDLYWKNLKRKFLMM